MIKGAGEILGFKEEIMANQSNRTQRVGDMIQRVLAEALQREVHDPRISMVSISGVEVTRDLAHAKVYVSILGDKSKVEAAMTALNKASGFLRSMLAKSCELRMVPALHFFHDTSVEYGRQMADLIDKARTKDQSDTDE
ncbi:MAG: ribosome-binding factor [Gammaproteobacteria bacterium]|jgi:ribosome-binding factor A|nr:ribosome-binding factor [Gammaproteobacteria bacterium]